jgi:hypothetical protein
MGEGNDYFITTEQKKDESQGTNCHPRTMMYSEVDNKTFKNEHTSCERNESPC